MIKRIFRFLWVALAVPLFLLLILQAAILIIDFNGKNLPLPGWITAKITQALEKNQISLDSSALELSLNGEIHAQKLKVFYKNKSQPLVTADALRLKIHIPSLLTGNIIPKALTIENATLFCPPFLSASGLYEPLATNFNVSLKLKDNAFAIQQFSVLAGNIHITAEGTWPYHQFAPSQKALSPLKPLGTASLVLSQIQKVLNVKNPQLHIVASASNTKNPTLSVHFKGNSLRIPLLRYATQNFSIHSKFTFPQSQTLPTAALIAQFNALTSPNSFSAKKASLTLQSDELLFDIASLSNLKSTSLNLQNLSYNNSPIDFFQLNSTQINFPNIKGAFVLKKDEHLLLGNVLLNAITQNIKTTAHGFASLEKLSTFFAPSQNILKDLSIGTPPFFIADLALNKNFQFRNASLDLFAQDTRYERVYADNLYAYVDLFPTDVIISKAIIEGPRTSVRGSYWQNLSSSSHRFLLRGRVPHEILNPWLGAWWPDLWKPFDLQGNLPLANVDIQGNWKDPSKQFFFGLAKARNIVFREVPLDTVALNIHTTPYITELSSIKSTSGTAFLNGNLQFHYNPQPSGPSIKTKTSINATSTFPLPYVSNLAQHEKTTAVLREFRTSNPPHVSFNGSFYPDTTKDYFSEFLFR